MVYLALIDTPSMSIFDSNAGFHFVLPFQGNGGDGASASVGALATLSNFSKFNLALNCINSPLNGRDLNSIPNAPISSRVVIFALFKSGNLASIMLLAPAKSNAARVVLSYVFTSIVSSTAFSLNHVVSRIKSLTQSPKRSFKGFSTLPASTSRSRCKSTTSRCSRLISRACARNCPCSSPSVCAVSSSMDDARDARCIATDRLSRARRAVTTTHAGDAWDDDDDDDARVASRLARRIWKI